MPDIAWSGTYLTLVVAVFGATISPYLFFWQAEQEVEDAHERMGSRPLLRAPEQARHELLRLRLDTYVGMAFSNLIASGCLPLGDAGCLAVGGLRRNRLRTMRQSKQNMRAKRIFHFLTLRVERIYQFMEFGWDPDKSDTTYARRGFDFAFAAGIFTGPTVEVVDTRHD